MSGGFIDRYDGLSRIIDVRSEVQAQIITERRLQCLLQAEGLNKDHRANFATTMAQMCDPTIDPCEVGVGNIGNKMEGLTVVDLP